MRTKFLLINVCYVFIIINIELNRNNCLAMPSVANNASVRNDDNSKANKNENTKKNNKLKYTHKNNKEQDKIEDNTRNNDIVSKKYNNNVEDNDENNNIKDNRDNNKFKNKDTVSNISNKQFKNQIKNNKQLLTDVSNKNINKFANSIRKKDNKITNKKQLLTSNGKVLENNINKYYVNDEYENNEKHNNKSSTNSDNVFKRIINKISGKKNTDNELKNKKKILTIVGVDDKEVLNAIHNQITVELENPTQIERQFWIKYNKNELYKILYSYGYFDAKVEPFNNKTIKKFKIKLNTKYKISKLKCIYDDYKEYKSGLTVKQLFNLVGIKLNTEFSTKKVSSGTSNLRDYYRRRGFAFVSIEKPDIEIDYNKKTVTVLYHINLSAKTTINDTIINIHSKKNPELLKKFIINRITWKKEDIYNIDTINNFKEDLTKYDLFATIEVTAKEPLPDYDNDVHTTRSDIIVTAKEAMLREISAGVKFNTTNWFGLEFSWKHHNIDGRGSNISLTGDLDKNTPSAIIKHNIYDILFPKQCLSTQLFGLIENTSSYNVRKFGAESIISHRITRHLTIGIGGRWEKSKTLDKVPEKKKQGAYIDTFGIPIELKFDNTDNSLDPQKGLRLSLNFTPYFLNKTRYNVVLAKASTYIGLKEQDELRNKFVLAIYSKYGTMLMDDNIEIPRSKYFFSGGVDSIRGYGNKKIGPLGNKTKKPTGGTSIFEIGIEPRFRVSNNMCLTAFVEAGTVFDRKNTKNLFKDLMYGYGVGLIYYTPIAPIRVNLAFPTKRRKNNKGKYIDSFCQLYISIGQAF
ncbi:MAG: BamA/TamA family outer membrane protein [Alphaproteobacteria bacterium]|nr:BamA/TamA family outer membrane protein [Alphaproteobacteria bacterium]